jgi:hypothetical protein
VYAEDLAVRWHRFGIILSNRWGWRAVTTVWRGRTPIDGLAGLIGHADGDWRIQGMDLG